MMKMKSMMSNNERYSRLLRPLNTSDGRDAIELEIMECDECDKEWCVDSDDNEMSD